MGIKFNSSGLSLPRFHFSKVFFLLLYFLLISSLVIYGLSSSKITNAQSFLVVPSIGLRTPVVTIHQNPDRTLPTPDRIAGLYLASPQKLFLIGHSTTVFRPLPRLELGQTIELDGQTYYLRQKYTLEKTAIDMADLLKPATTKTLVLMTCAGDSVGNEDYTHRLILVATL